MVSHFRADVNNPDNISAEQVTFDALTSYFAETSVTIEDVRDQHIKWDFILNRDGAEYTVDTKCDSYVESSGRLPFEILHVHDGSRVEVAWGLNERLDYIAVIPRRTFHFVKLIPMLYFRSYVFAKTYLHTAEELESEHDWRFFQKQNVGIGTWVTHGVAVPIQSVERYLNTRNASITHIDLPESVHKRQGRLLMHGREVA